MIRCAALIAQLDPDPNKPLGRAATWTDQLLTRAEQFTPELIGTGVIVLVTLAVYLLLSRLIRVLMKTTHLEESVGVTLRTLLRWLTVVLGGAAVLNHWEVLQNFWAAATAAVTLVAIGFVAVWSVLSNVLCSLILLATRGIRIGDHIQLPPDDIKGTVKDINLLHTILRDEDGQLFQIPNNLFFQRVVKRRPRKGQGKLFGVLSFDAADESPPDMGGKDSGIA